MKLYNLFEELQIDEGFREKPYRCPTGHWTIGFGHMFEDDTPEELELLGLNVKPLVITRDQGLDILKYDIEKAQKQLYVKYPWALLLDSNRRYVLENMCFNMGIGKLSTFINTLEFIRTGRFKSAANNMRKSLWATQVGDRAKRLAKIIEDGE